MVNGFDRSTAAVENIIWRIATEVAWDSSIPVPLDRPQDVKPSSTGAMPAPQSLGVVLWVQFDGLLEAETEDFGGASPVVGEGDVQGKLRPKEVFHILRVHTVDIPSDSPSLWRQTFQVVNMVDMIVHIHVDFGAVSNSVS